MSKTMKTLLIWGVLLLIILSLFIVLMINDKKAEAEGLEKFNIEADQFSVELEAVIGTDAFKTTIETYGTGSNYAMLLNADYEVQYHPNEEFVGMSFPLLGVVGMEDALDALSEKESTTFRYVFNKSDKVLYMYKTSEGTFLLIARDVDEIKKSY